MTRGGGFAMRRQAEAILFDIRPARPAFAFLAAVVLLGGIFLLPALAVLLDPRRHDAVSLTAAACALAILGLALLAWRRARRHRQPRCLCIDGRGIGLEGETIPWPACGALRIARPDPGRYAALQGIHGLGAAIAARQQAAENRLLLERRDRSEATLLAGGLSEATATALHSAIDAAIREKNPTAGE